MTAVVDPFEDGRAAQDLHDHGLSWNRIAVELGYSVATVRRLAADYSAHVDAHAHQHQTTLF